MTPTAPLVPIPMPMFLIEKNKPYLQGGLLDAGEAVASSGADVGIPVLEHVSEEAEAVRQRVLHLHVEVSARHPHHLCALHELQDGRQLLNCQRMETGGEGGT